MHLSVQYLKQTIGDRGVQVGVRGALSTHANSHGAVPNTAERCNTLHRRVPMLGRFPVELARVVHTCKGDVIEFWMLGVIVAEKRRAAGFA